MAAKDSQAQIEVWAWKEKIYQQVKDMPLGGAIKYILEKARPTSRKLKKNQGKRPEWDKVVHFGGPWMFLSTFLKVLKPTQNKT